LADSSGNSKNLSITGTINTNYWLGEAGEQGTCFRTDGLVGFASRNESVMPTIDNTNFTLFALFKGGTDFSCAAALAITNHLNEKGRAQMGSSLVSPLMASATSNGATCCPGAIKGGVAFDGTWHSVAYRRTVNFLELFVDGVRVASKTQTFDTPSTSDRTSLMHGLSASNPPARHALGSIQHAAIWNTALSDGELAAIQAAR
jgi:hypothetical protein